MNSVKIVVRGCAWCHFAQRVEGTDDLVLYCRAMAPIVSSQLILPKGALTASSHDGWRAFPNVDTVGVGPSEEEAYGTAPEWCPLRKGPISVELAPE